MSKHPRRTKKETLDAAMKTAAEAFSNPFHDLYKDQVRRQLDEYYTAVETRLRNEFSKEFLRKNKASEFLVIAVGAVVVLLATITRIPWEKVWSWCKWILHQV